MSYLPFIRYVLYCKPSCALEKKNPKLPVYELFKSKIEPEFKKGKLLTVTSSTGNRLKQEVIKENATLKGYLITANICYT